MQTTSIFRLLLCACAIALKLTAQANTAFLGIGDPTGFPPVPSGLTNFAVSVPTNKLMVIRASSLSSDTGGDLVKVSSGGGTYAPDTVEEPFATLHGPRYLAGPCTFSYTNTGSGNQVAIFQYDIISADSIYTKAGTNFTIQVIAGQRLRLLDGSFPVSFKVSSTNGIAAQFEVTNDRANFSDSFLSPDDFEIAGPVTIQVTGDAAHTGETEFLTYFFASDIVQAAGPSLQTPAGGAVTIEKSTDMQTWQPAFFSTETTSPKAFYRIKATK